MNLEEAKKLNCACVYCLEFPNGMKYVGKSKDLSKRISLYLHCNGANKYLSAAIAEFGFDSVDISILSQIECRDKIDLDLCLSILEIKYIRELGTIYPNGYNVSLGGEVLGIPVEYLTTDKDLIKNYYDGNKSVLLYDLNGDFIREYPSIAACSYDNGWDDDVIRNVIGKHTPFYGKFFLRFKRYDYAPNKIELPKGYEVRERVKYKNVVKEVVVEKEREVFTYTPALRYDMNGKFCGEYKSKRDALRSFTNSKRIGWGEYANGYIIFKKKGDDYPKEIEPYHVLSKKVLGEYYVPASELRDIEVHKDWLSKPKTLSETSSSLHVDGKYTNIKHTFKVYQCKKNGEVVATFDSIRDASHETGIAYSQIYNCLRGQTKSAAGFLWKNDECDSIKL